jgi:hypothetical protein
LPGTLKEFPVTLSCLCVGDDSGFETSSSSSSSSGSGSGNGPQSEGRVQEIIANWQFIASDGEGETAGSSSGDEESATSSGSEHVSRLPTGMGALLYQRRISRVVKDVVEEMLERVIEQIESEGRTRPPRRVVFVEGSDDD